MEHLDEEIIIEMLNRMIGSIHAHGETNHDNLAYNNLMAFDEILDSFIGEVIEEAQKCNSPYFSEKRSGEYALTMLKNLNEYLQDILPDLLELHGEEEQNQIQEEKEVYVCVYYSFDRECPLYVFDSVKKAQLFIDEQYEHEIKITKQDADLAQVKASVCDVGFAEIIFDNDSNDVISWKICEPRNLKEK